MIAVEIKVEHVNPFLKSTVETFQKMVGVSPKPGKIVLKGDSGKSYDISGMIGISGKVKGMISLSFPKDTAIKITNKFSGTNHVNIHADTVDAIGELANIVAGNAKKELTELRISISLAMVINGEKHEIRELRDVRTFVIPFETELGNFDLAVGLKSEE